MTRFPANIAVRSALYLSLACVVALGSAPGIARADDHHRGGRGDYRGDRRGGWHGGRWAGGYYPAPPVVYEGGYYPPPPPVVYAPGVSVNLPGISVGIR